LSKGRVKILDNCISLTPNQVIPDCQPLPTYPHSTAAPRGNKVNLQLQIYLADVLETLLGQWYVQAYTDIL